MTVRSTISGYGNHIVYVDDEIIGSCRKSAELWSASVQYRGYHISISGIKSKAKIIDMMAAAYLLLEKGND